MELRTHTTPELEQALGERVVAREQIHAWPLSLVEALTTASGRQLIYKAQLEPTCEAEFYASARSPILPACQIVERDAQQAALLLPMIEAPTLRSAGLGQDAIVAHGRAVIVAIGRIEGAVPLYVDLGTVEAWRAFAGLTLDMLATLVGDGRFARVSPGDIGALARWAETRPVLDMVDRTSQLINADLKAEHIFLTVDGYRVIDWQRPYRGPAEIDLVCLLESMQIPAEAYAQPAAIALRSFLFVHWAAEAKLHLLPELPFFDAWARSGIDTIGSAMA
jgi:hypothetical protein